ncbi:Lysophospholipase [Grifola frondosa]|uniref:Lysophospholipase n=1 Tax=Grifola frondosa TaxID=5627 RepID=A0A1C7MQA3_GRIFR|nr:Lysophospholipase [Grifola frondosa]
MQGPCSICSGLAYTVLYFMRDIYFKNPGNLPPCVLHDPHELRAKAERSRSNGLEFLPSSCTAKYTFIPPSYVHDILSGRYGSAGFPKVAIAVSGGGYRAAIFGAGVLHALDGRNAQSVEVGTGGLLQATSYLSGLSGGSWLVGSLAQANFPTIPDLIFGTANDSTDTDAYDENLRLADFLSQEEYLIPRALAGTPNASVDTFGSWLTDIDFVEPSIDSEVTEAYILSIEEEVVGKEDAGFPVSDTDFQGRLFSRHFVNGTDAADFFDTAIAHGAGITFSSIANVTSFKAYAQPRCRTPDKPHLRNEFFEMGSFDPMLSAFIPMKYLGTSNDSICVTNFDQVCFVESMSSFGPQCHSSGALIPNPFMGIAKDTFIDTNETILHLVDGSSDGEFVPIQPFLVKARGIDVILAVDAGNQTHGNETNNNFADGSSLIATQDRAALYPSYYSFPPVPSLYTTFLAQNLTKRPTFFGCDADPSAPLVIYLANGAAPLGQNPVTNISSARSSIPSEEVEAMLAQTFDIATQGIPIETYSHGSSC